MRISFRKRRKRINPISSSKKERIMMLQQLKLNKWHISFKRFLISARNTFSN